MWVLGALVIVAIAVVVIHFSGSQELLAAKIAGIWTNPDQSMRIVIYDVDSVFRAEIVWVKEGLDKLLGKAILKNLKLVSRYGGEGTYLCPFTNRVMNVKLIMTSAGTMKLQLNDEQNTFSQTELWSQLKVNA